MQYKILEIKENPLLKRKEILVKIDYDGAATPSKKQVIDSISSQLGAEQDKIEVVTINGEVGMQAGKALIYIWQEKPKQKIKKKKEEKQQKESEKNKFKNIKY